MRNIFLTGAVGVGKSTVLKKALALLPELVCGGFRTVSASPVDGRREVLIEPMWEGAQRDAARLVGLRLEDGFVAYPEAFDTMGTAILAETPRDAKLLLMDELGIMEADAMRFKRAILAALDGPLPVLGVIKPKRSDFLDAVRAHPRSVVLPVTPENREKLPDHVAALLADSLAAQGTVKRTLTDI
jgi:nucleoside-triphosphatase